MSRLGLNNPLSLYVSSPIDLLKKYWGYGAFRPIQEEIIDSVLAGNDTLALLPTGGGKSICFQIPALAIEGLCLVVSPLIALMKDQVEALKTKNIPALFIHSGMSYYEVKQTLQNAAHGNFKFIYVSPERLETTLFKEFLPALNVNLIAVDEAHCISQWGYDFRPPYLRISHLRDELPKVPVLALTASATPLVQDDICDKLRFKQKAIFRQSFERPNLTFSVLQVDSKINKLTDILNKVQGSAIVYCRNRKRCKETAHLLQLNSISADYYHAGLQQEERNKKQEAWIQNRSRVMVCTNAFGMGIDKPDVRLVVHLDIPDNLENYYQEAGRAGRDRLRAFAVLLYAEKEITDLKNMPRVKYPELKEIRKIYQALANYLQIPVGAGEGMYYGFDINEFVRNFGLNILMVVNALKALEQEGHLMFNEQVFVSTKVAFTAEKETLNSFGTAHPDLDNVIKYLLRTYEGIFDNVISVNESLIARLTKLQPDVVVRQMKQLHSFGIIDYQPQKEDPQVYFFQNRAPADYLVFNNEAYTARKEKYIQRVDAMLRFILLEKGCRSRFIGQYFGDTAMPECGSCDNCLKKKNAALSTADFILIRDCILRSIGEHGTEIKDLLQNVTGFKKEKVWKVLDYLQAEKELVITEKGMIVKKTWLQN